VPATPPATPSPTLSLTPVATGDLEALVAYQGFSEGKYVINLVRRDGTGHIGLTGAIPGQPHEHPDFSPDGKRIVFNTQQDLYLIDNDGQNAQLIVDCAPPCSMANEPAWSHDGSTIAFQRQQTDGSSTLELHTLATGETNVVFTGVGPRQIYAPRWSPDDKQIVFEYTHANAQGHFDGVELTILDLATGATHKLTDYGLFANNPDWSPLGDVISFSLPINGVASGGPDGPSDVAVINVDGTGLRRVTDVAEDGQIAVQPTITPAGDEIVFGLLDHAGAPMKMAIVPIAGGTPESVIATGPVEGYHPRLQPTP
jgi:Tol biopolymer transport system component